MDREYYLGLDMGTGSVGWAVTDKNYNLIRVKGKDFWGVREFDEALTAVDRRSHRISRRRHQRQQVRNGLLKSYFADTIEKEDPYFFVRLDNSKYFPEDKDKVLCSKNGIFADENYQDKDYYEEYPTIFHLRKELIEDTVPFDNRYARKLYLALLNMFKHRGHFLYANIGDDDTIETIETIYPRFVDMVDSVLDRSFPTNVGKEIEEVLSDRSISRSVKEDKIMSICGFDKKNKIEQILVKGICGLKIDGKKLFESLETEEKVDIQFSDFSYDERKADLQAILGDENYELIEIMKEIYDAGMLSSILKGSSYLSIARVQEYKKHHQDLMILKGVFKKNKSEKDYNEMFREDKAGSYSAYVKSTNVDKINTKPIRRSASSGRTRDDFYKTVQKYIKDIKNSDEVNYILSEIKNETFMPKQLNAGNGVIPNRIHKMEMNAILKNASKYLPFLKEIDDSGLSVAERIIRLFTFQIPYYIGPVSEKSALNHGNGWVVRKEAGQVLPWNIQDKIDIEKTQEEFIKRLIRNCSYLDGEKVLPKSSLMYEAFCVLNEINNIKINGERIDVPLKQAIYTDLFCRGKKVTRKQLTKYLHAAGVITEDSQISGIDIAINNSLSSYGKFYSIFGEDLKKDRTKKQIERIVELSTIYGDSKKTLREAILKEVGDDYLTEEQLKKILGFKFKDWGRLSRTFLELQACNTQTGEIMSLIRALWETNYNLIELINSDKFTFKQSLEDRKYKAFSTLADFKVEDLDEMYFSAPVKRMVWQAILLIKEIEKIMGCAPSKVFIEMTRKDDQKGERGRKSSRGKQLIELYKTIKEETRQWEKEITVADENGSLRSKKLYLYYLQMGRCMYTGEPIELEELFTTKYDIDHIYPRCYVKDDNISNNLVLVNKSSNAYKSDKYPLGPMKTDVYDLWRRLHDTKTANGQRLMSDEKYRRLTSKNPFTEEEKAGFIARQIVETSQGTKGIADLLKQLFSGEKTKIIYVKAGNVSDFRRGEFLSTFKKSDQEEYKNLKFLKSRLLNEFHHAKDAYLNIVVGNVYYTKFTQNPQNFIKKGLITDEKYYHYNLGKMYRWKVERNGVVAWIPGKEGTIATVINVMNKNTPLITKRTYEAKGAISKAELKSAKVVKAKGYIPLKEKDSKMQDIYKYGGFSSIKGAYFFLVEHEKRKKRIRTMEIVPIYKKNLIESSEKGLLKYCINDLGLKNPKICVPKIKMESLIEYNGLRYRLAGRSKDNLLLKNEVQLCLSYRWGNYIHYIEKFNETGNVPELLNCKDNLKLYDTIMEKHLNGIFRRRKNSVGSKLEKGREGFIALSLDQQCKALTNILSVTSMGSNGAKLAIIGLDDHGGRVEPNKNITEAESMHLIIQSVTGIAEKKINLLKV